MAAVSFSSMNSLRGPYKMYKTVKFLLKALVVDIPQQVQYNLHNSVLSNISINNDFGNAVIVATLRIFTLNHITL